MSKPDRYVLDEAGNPRPEPSRMTWANWFKDSSNWIVKQERIGPSRISTVFLGLDNNFSAEGPPVLWETLVFGGPLADEGGRCAGSREQAEAMHQAMAEKVRAAQNLLEICYKKPVHGQNLSNP